MSEILEAAINAAKTHSFTLCKFITPNDSGTTGSNQAGPYIPKLAVPYIFDKPGVKGDNKDIFITIKWYEGTTNIARFIYYGRGTRNEYRLTRLGKTLKEGELLILTKIDLVNYKAFLLNDKNDISKFIEFFNLNINEEDNIISHNIEKAAIFKPRARLLLQLGDQLIRNESVALLELIKNSYDADAKFVTILMENIDKAENANIIIEDDGYGMNSDIVENVWMEPGSEFKTKQFENLELTPKYKRLPIGEKGIGRFGVHKLGNKIEMVTKKEGHNEVYVTIDWELFNSNKYLDEIPIKILENSVPVHFKNGKTGTYIVITSLRNPWTRGQARNTYRAITSLNSPFETNDNFKPKMEILDQPSWLDGLMNWEDIKDYSLFNFEVEIKDSEIQRFEYNFTPWKTMPKLSGRRVGESNEYVKEFKRLTDENENPITLEGKEIGTVIFKGYIFDQDTKILTLGVQDKKTYKDYLRENGGVRVYRDGLRVYDYGEPDNDWLGLDLRRVNIPARRLSNNILLGAVYIQRKDSQGLEEKTNREGFVENQPYDTFRAAILHCIDLIETLRYSDKQKLREIYGPTPKSEPVLQILGDLKDYIIERVKENEVKNEITRYLIKIENDYKKINEILLKAAGAGLSLSVVVHEVEKIILEIQKILKQENVSQRLVSMMKHLSELIDGYTQILRKSTKQVEDLKEVISQAIFNTEFRLNAHNIIIESKFLEYKNNSKIKATRSLLIGVLMNIFDNSIYWLNKADRKIKKIYINIEESNDFLSIIIADNGTGFILPTEEITEPFVSGKPGGMGLGLHIAHEIMVAQGGTITFPDNNEIDIPDEFNEGAIISLNFKK